MKNSMAVPCPTPMRCGDGSGLSRVCDCPMGDCVGRPQHECLQKLHLAPITASEIMASKAKASNPKEAVGGTKLPLDLIPATAMSLISLAHLDGALKYGAWNWRIEGVRASTYMAAVMRHLQKWFHGETIDPDSGLHHLAMAGAGINILIDADAIGKLTDDRPPQADIGGYFNDLTPHVVRLTEKHAAHKPRNYTIHDSETHSQR